MTRQHYYYQLRENVLRHGQPATEESFFRLAALALQAELGDYDPERHRAAYFDTQLYFPQWVRTHYVKIISLFFSFSLISFFLSLREYIKSNQKNCKIKIEKQNIENQKNKKENSKKRKHQEF